MGIAHYQVNFDTKSPISRQNERLQWELEQKLEQLSAKKNEAEQLKHVLTENERIQEELDALDPVSYTHL